MKKRSGVVIYFQWLPVVQTLSFERSGRLFQAILHYGKDGAEPDFSSDEVLAALWPLLRESIDADAVRYALKIEKTRYSVFCKVAREKGEQPLTFEEWRLQTLTSAANNNYQKQKETESNNNFFLNNNPTTCCADAPPPPTKKGFVAPSVDEVQSFAITEGLPDDAKNFVNYYQSIDWKSGKSQIVDWRARYRSWVSSDRQRSAAAQYTSGADRLAMMIAEGRFDD